MNTAFHTIYVAQFFQTHIRAAAFSSLVSITLQLQFHKVVLKLLNVYLMLH